MTLTDEPKFLDDKIKANQDQYDLGREKAKISELSPKELDKYEYYLTGEDLECKPQQLDKLNFNIIHCIKIQNQKKKIKKEAF